MMLMVLPLASVRNKQQFECAFPDVPVLEQIETDRDAAIDLLRAQVPSNGAALAVRCDSPNGTIYIIGWHLSATEMSQEERH